MQLGIDFGTTRTVVAVRDQGNYPVLAFENLDGDVHDHFPSWTASDGQRLEHGFEAIARLEDPDWEVMRSLKRHLVSPTEGSRVILGGRSWPVDQLLQSYLAALKQAIETCVDGSLSTETSLETNISVPAAATSHQRLLTMDAFHEAGFEVCGLYNEPSAAGIGYAHAYPRTFNRRRREVLVYDLGGGTFDVSLLRVTDEEHRVVAHAGDNQIGGDDFDEILLTLVLHAVGIDPRSIEERERPLLLHRCQQAKEALNPNRKVVTVEVRNTPVNIPVAQYYEACQPLLTRTVDVLRQVVPAMSDHPLAGVYVVGGASQLPAVARRLRQVFPRRVRRASYASAATAVGLAMAHSPDAPALREPFRRTFGVYREGADGAGLTFDPILSPDTTVQPGGTIRTRRYRVAHNVGLFRFVECTGLQDGMPAGDIQPWRRVRFPFLPELQSRQSTELTIPVVRLMKPGTLVEERYRIDASGAVRLSIVDLETGFHQEHELRTQAMEPSA